jgi:gas vesicle protein
MRTRDYGWGFGALLIAALVGVVVGILFAPDRGEKTRKMLSKRAAGYRDQAGELYGEGMDYVGDAIDQGKTAADETGRKLKTEAGHLQEQVADSAKSAKSAIHKATK